jgi:hypothetical protein
MGRALPSGRQNLNLGLIESRERTEMRKITKGWLISVSSHHSGSGWTKEQLALLGIEWPPKKNWVQQIEGRLLEEDTARRIEDLGWTARHS